VYTKEELRALRDSLVKEANNLFNFKPGWPTASYIYKALMDSCDPQKLESYMSYWANLAKYAYIGPEDVDYTLAYDLFFGDISVAPLHINDALDLIATWRLKSPNSPVSILCAPEPFL